MAKASVLTILCIVFVLAITSRLSVFASVNPTAYVDSTTQFSINPPSGWTVDSSGSYGTAVILYGPTDSNFRINMNIIVQATTLSLSDYVAANKQQLQSSLANYQLVSEVSIMIGGVTADQLVNKFTEVSYGGIEDKQDIMVQNQKAYVITSTALQTNYATYQPSFDESVQTFKLTTTGTGAAFPWTILIIIFVVVAVVAIGLVVGLTVHFAKKKGEDDIPPPYTPPTPSLPAPE